MWKTLRPLSLVLKEMAMGTGTYQGSPAEAVDGLALLVPPATSPTIKEVSDTARLRRKG
jgi:hypothetical protein